MIKISREDYIILKDCVDNMDPFPEYIDDGRQRARAKEYNQYLKTRFFDTLSKYDPQYSTQKFYIGTELTNCRPEELDNRLTVELQAKGFVIEEEET